MSSSLAYSDSSYTIMMQAFAYQNIQRDHAEVLIRFMEGRALRYGEVYNIPDYRSQSIYSYVWVGRERTPTGWDSGGRSSQERMMGMDFASGRDGQVMYYDPFPQEKSEPKKKAELPKQKKAPKAVRHSYLKKRLQERLNKK